MPQPPDHSNGADASERKYRSRKRAEEAGAISAAPPPEELSSGAEKEHHPFSRPASSAAASAVSKTPADSTAAPVVPVRIEVSPTLERGGSSAPRRVDIVLPNPSRALYDDAQPQQKQARHPIADPPRATRQLPSPERAAPPSPTPRIRFWQDPLPDEYEDDEEYSDEAYEDDAPATSRIVQMEREGIAALKKHWSSVLIGVFGFVVVITLFVLGGQWMRETQRKEAEQKRINAEIAERANYPLDYRELIEANAADFDLDPALVAAIIMKESSFHPDSLSNKAAQGLMQIVPATAQQIADSLDEPGFTVDQVYEPEVNIRFGCWYLRYLLDTFHDDLKEAICAYHAGEGNVRSWLSKPEYSDDGITLTTIPTEGIVDTAGYYAYVTKAIGIYHKYYFPIEGEATTTPNPAE